jgi:hypothetical protein
VPLRRKSTALRRGDKVIAVRPVGRVPEGTTGVIQVIDGFNWTRYWVLWSTGEWTGSVYAGSVVAVGRYEAYKREQIEAADRAVTSTAAAPVAAVTPADGGGSGIPEHLLERSRQARARNETAAS